jgi:hypothetical protein
MPIPFPGMNPYLEHPDLWPGVHQKMITALAHLLEKQLPTDYRVRLRERHYRVSGEDSLVVGSPGLDWGRSATETKAPPAPAPTPLATPFSSRDRYASGASGTIGDIGATGEPAGSGLFQPALIASEKPAAVSPETAQPKYREGKKPIAVLIPIPQKIYETYLEVVSREGSVVTVIEALSPKKKRPGRGRMLYERQREAIFGSSVHFVEIDLLRGWEPPSIYGPDEAGDYRILISRSEQRPRAQLYTWTVTEPIPPICLPLSGQDELPLCLKTVVDQACDRTDLLVNYQSDPLPPLRYQESLWLEDFLQKVGMRPCAS